MGQVLGRVQGKEWRNRQIKKITDRVFDSIKDQSEKANLPFEDLYITVLLVYNDINKYLPGPHFDPPSKDQVRAVMQESDINFDGEIDRDEFLRFMKLMTADTFADVSEGLMLTLVVAPIVAVATRRAVEAVPGVGKMVQLIPNSVYASIVTFAVVLFQKLAEDLKLVKGIVG